MPTPDNQSAKQKSIDLLEVSVATMCTILGVDQADLTDGYVIPVDQEHRLYRSYESLVHMNNTLSNLKA